jgi:hypothetical protein
MRFWQNIADDADADRFKILDRVAHANIDSFRLPHSPSDFALVIDRIIEANWRCREWGSAKGVSCTPAYIGRRERPVRAVPGRLSQAYAEPIAGLLGGEVPSR